MSKQTPMLMESLITKRVYIVTSYVDNGNGMFTARQKYDVTEQFEAIAKQRKSGDDEMAQLERIAELESLVKDMWEFGESSKYPYTPLESVRWAQMREELGERMAELGLLDGDAE